MHVDSCFLLFYVSISYIFHILISIPPSWFWKEYIFVYNNIDKC